MAKNFAVKMVPAGSWRRIEGTTPAGGDGEDRPHIVPLNDGAEAFISLDAFGGAGSTGLCPGMTTENSGETWTHAYRFLASKGGFFGFLHRFLLLRRIKKITLPKLEQTFARTMGQRS